MQDWKRLESNNKLPLMFSFFENDRETKQLLTSKHSFNYENKVIPFMIMDDEKNKRLFIINTIFI